MAGKQNNNNRPLKFLKWAEEEHEHALAVRWWKDLCPLAKQSAKRSLILKIVDLKAYLGNVEAGKGYEVVYSMEGLLHLIHCWGGSGA